MIGIFRTGLLCLVFCFLQPGLSALPTRENPRDLVIYGIRGPSGLGMVGLFDKPVQAPGFSTRIETLAQADLVAARFISGEAKIGILPPNMAAKIASSGKDIRIAAVIGMGMLSLLTSDPDVNGIGDLKGKTVEAAGQGATPDYVFRAILSNNGLVADTDVRLGFSLAYPEIAQSLIAGRISTALLPEPFATQALLARPSLRSVCDIRQQWQDLTGTDNFPMTVIAVDGNFASANPQALKIILSDIEESVKWTVANPQEAGLLAQKYDLGFPPDAAALAIPKSNYVYIPAGQARAALENLYGIFLRYSPVSIGGVMPGDEFYLQ